MKTFQDKITKILTVVDVAEPANAKEALNNPVWRMSIDKEYKALIDSKT